VSQNKYSGALIKIYKQKKYQIINESYEKQAKR